MLVLHHLGISQSERITWLLEELEIEYKLVKHTRAPSLSPDSLKNVPGNKTGKSPFLEDTEAGITLSESGAITDYIIWKYGGGRLALKPNDKNFAEYLHWKDFSNATLQPAMLTGMFLSGAQLPGDNPIVGFSNQRLYAALQVMDDRLKDNKWLAGNEFTAADTMSVYPVTTQRYWGPVLSLKDYPNILRWLKDCSERPAYQKAMRNGDPEMKPLLKGDPPENLLMAAGGVESNIWKK